MTTEERDLELAAELARLRAEVRRLESQRHVARRRIEHDAEAVRAALSPADQAALDDTLAGMAIDDLIAENTGKCCPRCGRPRPPERS